MSIILHIFAELNLINNIMCEKEEMVWYNKKENVAIVSYTGLLDLLEANLKLEDENKSLSNQVSDLRQVVDSWESLMSMVEVEVFVDKGSDFDFDTVEETFNGTVPYEYYY